MDRRLFHTSDTYLDFLLEKKTPIEELACVLYEIVHVPTGAKILHVANDDPENLFCLSFRTYPENSRGVAHILEHTVLCGSHKYPVKDPFFAMIRRSMNTFMNAFTGSDFTCYPAASQIEKDFYNLLEVYVDAVFWPNLKELSFRQEGHRLEFTDPQDSQSPLIYKGVVYNEMKGSLSSGDSRLWKAMLAELFPDICYHFDFGGDPAHIPELSYQELLAFHKKHYATSQCLYFFYGNFPLKGHLDFLLKHVFQQPTSAEPLSSLPRQKRFKAPKSVKGSYPFAPGESLENKAYIAFGWLTCPILDQEELLALQVLDIVLMGTDGAPLKKPLLQSGLCRQASLYMDNEMSEVPIVLVLKGCQSESHAALKKLVHSTLQKIVEEGLPSHLIDGAIHQLEFSRSEIGASHGSFGLTLFMRAALLVQHGGNPSDGLRTHGLFAKLREQVKNTAYLPSLIQRYLLNNPHAVELTLVPDPLLSKTEEDKEKKRLEALQHALKKEEADQIIAEAIALEAFQKQQETQDLDVLPKISLDEIPQKIRSYPLKQIEKPDLRYFHHNCFTNDILYLSLHFDLPMLPAHEQSLARLFTVLLPEVGAGGRNYVEHLEYLQEHTGGLGCGLMLHHPIHEAAVQPAIGLSSKCLFRKVDKLFPLLHDVIASADFTDKGRIQELLLQHLTGIESSLQHKPLQYATNLSASALSQTGRLHALWYGLDYVAYLKKLVDHFSSHPETLIQQLESLKERLLHGTPDIVACGSKQMCEQIETKVEKLGSRGGHHEASHTSKPSAILPQGRIIASPVAFTALAFPCVGYTHPDAPYLLLAATLLDNKVLHPRIREKGGAYGSGASFNASAGQFSFYAYRDPHIASTLITFEEAMEEIASGHFDAQDLEETKLSVLQDSDAPVSPGSRGEVAYAWLRAKKTDSIRESYRKRMIDATASQIRKAVLHHLVERKEKGSPVSFASAELLEKENRILKDKGLPGLAIHQLME